MTRGITSGMRDTILNGFRRGAPDDSEEAQITADRVLIESWYREVDLPNAKGSHLSLEADVEVWWTKSPGVAFARASFNASINWGIEVVLASSKGQKELAQKAARMFDRRDSDQDELVAASSGRVEDLGHAARWAVRWADEVLGIAGRRAEEVHALLRGEVQDG